MGLLTMSLRRDFGPLNLQVGDFGVQDSLDSLLSDRRASFLDRKA